MTYPVIAATNTSSNDTASTSAVVNLPASIVSGDLLVIAIALSVSTGSTATTPSGWTLLFADNIAAQGESSAVFYKIASGSEGASVTVTITSSKWAALSWRITGSDTSTAPAFSTRSKASTANPAPPALTPAWGSATTLWLTVTGYVGNLTVSSYPTGFYRNITVKSGTSADSASAASGATNDTVATETPGTFTLSVSVPSTAWTMAIKPAPSVGAAAGAATVTGVGAASTSGVAASSGAATVTGVGAASTSGVAASSGAATVTGIGKSTAASVGASAGVATVSGTGRSTAASVGVSAGFSTVLGVVPSLAVAAGIATVSGVGSSTAASIGAASGAATVTGIGYGTVTQLVTGAVSACMVGTVNIWQIVPVGPPSGNWAPIDPDNPGGWVPINPDQPGDWMPIAT